MEMANRELSAPFASVLLALGGTMLMAGCASADGASSVVVTYDAAGGRVSESFTPKGIKCDEDGLGVHGFSFPDKPFTSVRIHDGSSGTFIAWVVREQLVLFDANDVEFTVTTHDDGSVVYEGKDVGGEVSVADVTGEVQVNDPDLSKAKRYAANANFSVRCIPGE